AREQRQALRRLARGGDLDLDAEQLLCAVRDPPLLRVAIRLELRVLNRLAIAAVLLLARDGAAEQGRASLLVAHEPQRAVAAGEKVADELREVLRRGIERLCERLLDLPVDLRDQRAQLAHRRLEVCAAGLELLDVRDGIRVLVRSERVDGSEQLAPAREA